MPEQSNRTTLFPNYFSRRSRTRSGLTLTVGRLAGEKGLVSALYSELQPSTISVEGSRQCQSIKLSSVNIQEGPSDS